MAGTARAREEQTELLSRIGKYEVEAEIGHGTVVKMFRAWDRDTGRRVTLKVLTGARDRRLIDLFRREVANAARLRHKNIIAIYELGDHAGLPFAALQQLDDGDVRQAILTQSSLTLLQKAMIMWQVAEGLQAAHHGGLAYVGIRPSGIALAADGSVIIQDFSIVRVIGEGADEDVSYASPEELTAGLSPDPLCDVFAFGTIYYELLTGAHPFLAASPSQAKIDIQRQEPLPLRNLAPECPEALAQLVHRALDKNRERRYQSIDEIQEDAEPIVSELKRARAAMLLADARALNGRGELEQAQSVVREVLELDPGNRHARRLHTLIRGEQQRRMLAARLETMFREADAEAAARRFARAIEILTAAAQLDASHPEVTSRLEGMCARLEQSQHAAQLVADARQLLAAESFEEARVKTVEALVQDPECPETVELLSAIGDAIERHERQRAIEQQIAQASSLFEQEDYDAAISILRGLRSKCLGSPLVELWLDRVQTQKTERERQARFASEINSIRSLLAAERFSEARLKLAVLIEDFPADKTLPELFEQAGEAMARIQAIADATREALAEVQWLLDQDRPDLALPFLREKCAELTGQPELAAKLDAVERMLPDWEDRRCIQDALLRADALERKQQWIVALTLVEQALERCPGTAELLQTADRLRSCQRDEERRKKLARRLETIGQKMAAEAWPQALSLIAAAQTEFPEEPEFERLREEARAGQRRDECDAIVLEVRQCLADEETDRAEEILRKGLEALGQEPALEALRRELEAGKEDGEKWRRAQMLFGRRLFWEAEEVLLSLTGERPNAKALLETVRAARAASEENDFCKRGREHCLKLLEQQQFAQAADVLRNLLTLFPGDPILERDLQVAQAGLAPQQQATAAEGQGTPEPAAQSPASAEPAVGVSLPAPAMQSLETGFRVPASARAVRSATAIAALLLLVSASAGVWKLSRKPSAVAPAVPAPVAAPRQETRAEPQPILQAHARPQADAGRQRAKAAPSTSRQPFTLPTSQPPDKASAPSLPPPATGPILARQEAPGLPIHPADTIPPPPSRPQTTNQGVAVEHAPAPPPVGGRIQEPKAISHPAPAVPALALLRGVNGIVRLEATVDERGAVNRVTVLSGDPILVAAAKETVAKWRYQPGTLNGTPIAMKVQIQVSFQRSR